MHTYNTVMLQSTLPLLQEVVIYPFRHARCIPHVSRAISHYRIMLRWKKYCPYIMPFPSSTHPISSSVAVLFCLVLI